MWRLYFQERNSFLNRASLIKRKNFLPGGENSFHLDYPESSFLKQYQKSRPI